MNREEIKALLSVDDTDVLKALFQAARDVRRRYFGDKVFTYGFVYFSTFCRNNCSFCHYRRDNSAERYRKSAEEVAVLAGELEDSGVNLVDLTMGEDIKMYVNRYRGLIDVIEKVRASVSVPIMLSPGAVSEHVFPLIREAGADWFACYQETHNHELFSRTRTEQDYRFRSDQRRWARENGMFAEDGIMVGIGETCDDVADSVVQMGAQGCEQMRVMTFVPQTGTPMYSSSRKDRINELRTMAVMRLAYPDRLIPASLDVEGISGLMPRMNAGANVVTSIVPPHTDLAGVAQKELDINNGMRSLHHVADILEREGYSIGSGNEYTNVLKRFRAAVA